jgi:hypothetical protein
MAVSTENLLITVVITTVMSVQTKGSVRAIMTEIRVTIALFSEQQRSITVLLFMTMG